jgi:hypothetical protein
MPRYWYWPDRAAGDLVAEFEPAEQQDIRHRERLPAQVFSPAICSFSHFRRFAAIILRPGEASGATGIRFSKNFKASPKR